jgi:hypothetical protein
MFFQLKRRFPLANDIRVRTDRIPNIILACCVLHNAAKRLNDEVPDDVDEDEQGGDPEDDDPVAEEDPILDAPQLRVQGQQRRRNDLAAIIHSFE